MRGQFGEYDWPGFRNPAGKLVPPPLVLKQHPDGTLTCASFPGWEQYRATPPAPAETANSAGWQLSTAPGSMDVVAGQHDTPDFLFEGTLTLAAAAGGLIFRLDDDEGGYTITLTPEAGMAKKVREGMAGQRKMQEKRFDKDRAIKVRDKDYKKDK